MKMVWTAEQAAERKAALHILKCGKDKALHVRVLTPGWCHLVLPRSIMDFLVHLSNQLKAKGVG